MAAGTWALYSKAVLEEGQGAFNLGTDTFVMALLTSSYTVDLDNHSTWADVSAFEASGTGYTSKVLASETWTLSGATVTWDAADETWTTITTTAKYAVIVRRAGGSLVSGDKLIAIVDLNSGGGSVSPSAGTLTIALPGIFTATHAP